MSQTGTGSGDRASTRAHVTNRGNRRLNKNQIKAMEIRSAETIRELDVPTTVIADVEAPVVPGSAVRRAVATSKRTIARPVALSKAQEYRFIRTDLRRLIYTASGLFVIMIALLFIFD